MTRKLIIPSLVLIVVGIIGGVVTVKDYYTHEQISGEETFNSDQIDSITINSNVANLQVQASSYDEVKVEWEGKQWTLEEPSIDMQVSDGHLHIDLGEKSFLNVIDLPFSFNFNQITLNVHVPEKQFQNIDVTNHVGSTKITSLQVDDLVVYSDVADVKLENITADFVDVTSSIGAVTLKEVEAEIRTKNDVGEIIVLANDIHGDMTLMSDVGNIEVKVPQIPEDVTFHGSSDIGSINIFGSNKSHISDQSQHVVYMETDVGGIDVVVD